MNKKLKNYQYSILRYLPDVNTGEFVNIGILFWNMADRKLEFKRTISIKRIANFFNISSSKVSRLLNSVTNNIDKTITDKRKIKKYNKLDHLGDIIDEIDKHKSMSFFNWSTVRMGSVVDPSEMFNKLFMEIIYKYNKE